MIASSCPAVLVVFAPEEIHELADFGWGEHRRLTVQWFT